MSKTDVSISKKGMPEEFSLMCGCKKENGIFTACYIHEIEGRLQK